LPATITSSAAAPPLMAVTSEQGEACEHAVPEPPGDAKRWAARADAGTLSRTTHNADATVVSPIRAKATSF
jgi:hypothetical protein